jgi:hypothetical protein
MYSYPLFAKAISPTVPAIFGIFKMAKKEQNRKIFLNASVWFSVLRIRNQGWVKNQDPDPG